MNWNFFGEYVFRNRKLDINKSPRHLDCKIENEDWMKIPEAIREKFLRDMDRDDKISFSIVFWVVLLFIIPVILINVFGVKL